MTVAIQGEWGSGKTSMMNQIRGRLCDGDNHGEKIYHPIWLNTWQYSLFTDENTAMIKIIKAIFDQVMAILENGNKENPTLQKTKKIMGGLLRGAIKMGAGMAGAGAIAEGGLQAFDDANNNDDSNLTVNDLRDALGSAIKDYIESESTNRRGFLVFIDDLDRIEPVVAVNILELLKNIFDIEYCIFILAIDYDVVVKGLIPKFGEPTKENEREFRSFFDKLIQLPFSMPIASYRVDAFLINSLKSIGYFDEKTLKDENIAQTLSEMSSLSVGKNPRAMKRLTNILSLIKIFNEISAKANEVNDEKHERIINFGLICLQLAYPTIYDLLSEHTAIDQWNLAKAESLGLPKLEEDVLKSISNQIEFDEDWEQFLYSVCQEDEFLKSNAVNISRLLNMIIENIPKNIEQEEILSKLLSLSSVTSVSVSGNKRSIKKGLKEFVDGFDSWIELKRTKQNFAPTHKGIQFTKHLHDSFISYCESNSIAYKVSYSGMMNFKFENQKSQCIQSWVDGKKIENLCLKINIPYVICVDKWSYLEPLTVEKNKQYTMVKKIADINMLEKILSDLPAILTYIQENNQ